MDYHNEPIQHVLILLDFMESFRGDVKEYSEKHELDIAKITEFTSSVTTDKELFLRVKKFHDNREGLGDDEKRLTEMTYLDFVDGGCMLDDEKKERFIELKKKIDLTCQKFAKNSIDGKDVPFVHVRDKKKLEGIPEFTSNEIL